MDMHAIEYYSAFSEITPHHHFHRVIQLNEEPLLDWEDASKLAPRLPRGWFELAQLPSRDRIEFKKEFWLSKMPYAAHLDEFINDFFSRLDDIGIFMTQQTYDAPFEVHMVYSLADNSGFFRGGPPAIENEIINLQKDFPNYILPADYFAFLQIHDGFAKLTDTGIIPSKNLKESYLLFQETLKEISDPITTTDGVSINPSSLIPFYESFGMPYFQCFWGEWYPDQEMGNVYYSMLRRQISTCKGKNECVETMAFETFTEWFMFYLEKVD